MDTAPQTEILAVLISLRPLPALNFHMAERIAISRKHNYIGVFFKSRSVAAPVLLPQPMPEEVPSLGFRPLVFQMSKRPKSRYGSLPVYDA
jgi:hypothetical protein